MCDFSFGGGVATIKDPGLLSTWAERADYLDALCASESALEEAAMRLVAGFLAATEAVTKNGASDAEIDGLVERFMIEGFVQHDPNIGPGRAGMAAFLRAAEHPWRPRVPVLLTAIGDLVWSLIQLKLPEMRSQSSDGRVETYDAFLPAIYRVRDGRLAEHWNGMVKLPSIRGT